MRFKHIFNFRKRKKQRNILEVGSADAEALVRRANRKRDETYTGVDPKSPGVREVLDRLGISDPGNIALIRGNAINHLFLTKPNTYNTIIGSYFINNLGQGFAGKINRLTFMKAVNESLRKKGKLILTHDLRNASDISRLAESTGFSSRTMKLSDKAASKSASLEVRNRASPEKRLRHIEQIIDTKQRERILREAEVLGLEPQEMLRPTITIMVKLTNSR